MKRLVRSKSGMQIYGPKWQNIEASSIIDIDDDGLHSAASQSEDGRCSASVESSGCAHVSVTQPKNTIMMPTSGVAAAQPTAIEANVVQPRITTELKGNRTGSRSMYKAAIEGDWVAAEKLLARFPTFARDEITERGDRALHVASAMKHKEFVRKLVERMNRSDLALLDGHGFTPCCYVAVSGEVEIAKVMIERNPDLATARDKNNVTPLYKAALHGNRKMVLYFLKSTKFKNLSKEEWFDLLLLTISRRMYDVSLEILEMDASLATIRNEEGTALHLLAGQDTSEDFGTRDGSILMLLEILTGVDFAMIFSTCWRRMQLDRGLLAKKLWAEINQRLEGASVLELMSNPPILHNAAKVGNVKLITMLTHAYPDLIWDTDRNRYTMFHIAVKYRQDSAFNLIHEIGALKDFIASTQDENGNNMLHLAGELAPPKTTKSVSLSAFQMQTEMIWFEKVKKIVPPLCLEMRNKYGQTPRELFSDQHKSLLENSETWMRNTADSCMLIATIIFTVVFAAAFTAPGGNDSETGIPILLKSSWFTCFVISEAVALFGSTFCTIMFWAIMTSSFKEDEFLETLPNYLRFGLSGLFLSLVGAITAFMSTYFLVFVEERPRLVKGIILLVYILLLSAIYNKFIILWLDMTIPEILQSTISLVFNVRSTVSRLSKHTLFSRTTKGKNTGVVD